MPVARSASIHSTPVIANNAVDTTDAGDGDGDGDDRTYCFCDGVSYGEMIACDDEACEREWVCILFTDSAQLNRFSEHSSILHVLVSTHHLRVLGFVKLAPIRSQRKEDVEVGNRKSEEAEQVQEVRGSSTHIFHLNPCTNLPFYCNYDIDSAHV